MFNEGGSQIFSAGEVAVLHREKGYYNFIIGWVVSYLGRGVSY